VLSNAEVIEVDQDELGRQARVVRRAENEFVLAKPLADGSLAVGLFNLGEAAARIAATWAELGIQGGRRARDLWRQTDIGTVNGQFAAEVPRHGVALARLYPR
jgi:alpha-galactosidase